MFGNAGLLKYSISFANAERGAKKKSPKLGYSQFQNGRQLQLSGYLVLLSEHE